MERIIERNLLKWKEQAGRKPLLVRGGRQVGKSHVIEKFGKAHFNQCVIVNFEFHRECLNAFKTLAPVKIIASLSVLRRQAIVPGKILLFIDEIQECPDAILALLFPKDHKSNKTC